MNFNKNNQQTSNTAEEFDPLLDPIVWLVAGNSFLLGVLATLLVIFPK